MEIVLVNCNGCGAALDVGPDTRFVTCAQCGARLAVKRSATAAYTEILEGLDRKTDAIAEKLATIERQNELERIDREWEQEREQYLLTGRHGTKSEPNAAMGVVMAVVVGGFGLFWTVGAVGAGGGGIAFLGLIFVAFAVIFGYTSVMKAQAFEAAEQRYRKRRAAALAEPADCDA